MSTKQSSDAPSETEIVKDVYAAINRNDTQAALKHFDPQIERIEPPGFATGGTYRGYAEVKKHFAQGRSTWAEGSCEPEQILIIGDKAVVFVHVHVRLKNKEEWIDARFADGFVFRRGKVIQMRTFATRDEAMQWAANN